MSDSLLDAEVWNPEFLEPKTNRPDDKFAWSLKSTSCKTEFLTSSETEIFQANFETPVSKARCGAHPQGEFYKKSLQILPVLRELPGLETIQVIPNGTKRSLDLQIAKLVTIHSLDDPFYLMDIGMVTQLHQEWVFALPRVMPFYAVKCSPQPALLAALAALGAGFDCASKAEISQVLAMGVAPEHIIYANPCKMPSHIAYAAARRVDLMTFDSDDELHKVAAGHLHAKLLLRIRADDQTARCALGVKYGALLEEVVPLLQTALYLGIAVTGVSFHVGSGASDPAAYINAIRMARAVFDTAVHLGMPPMTMLDIGGGFTARSRGRMPFSSAAAAISEALAAYFPVQGGVTIIAEPGRYFAEAPFTLATAVFGRRVRGSHHEYWINDGLYGSMNCTLYDHAILSARPLRPAHLCSDAPAQGDEMFLSTVFGPTCDGLDVVLQNVLLPELELSDWLVFPNMGAYSAAAGSSFNGFATSAIRTFYVYSMGPLHDVQQQNWGYQGISLTETEADGEVLQKP